MFRNKVIYLNRYDHRGFMICYQVRFLASYTASYMQGSLWYTCQEGNETKQCFMPARLTGV